MSNFNDSQKDVTHSELSENKSSESSLHEATETEAPNGDGTVSTPREGLAQDRPVLDGSGLHPRGPREECTLWAIKSSTRTASFNR